MDQLDPPHLENILILKNEGIIKKFYEHLVYESIAVYLDDSSLS